LFHYHEHANLHCLTELLEPILHCLNPNGPSTALGFQCKNIWDGSKTPKAIPPPTAGAPTITTSALPKHQAVHAVHVEVAKEHKRDAIVLLYKALQTKIFKHTTNLMMKLVRLYSDHPPFYGTGCHPLHHHQTGTVQKRPFSPLTVIITLAKLS